MPRPHPFRNALLAVSLLTAVPTRVDWPRDERPHVAGWFPLVGAMVGSTGYVLVKLAEQARVLRHAPFAMAALVVVVWALLTRLLHWDGLADVADGYWGSHDAARRLEIMADSHTGAFGAAAVAIVAALQVASLGSFIVRDQSPLIVVPLIARFAATAAAWLGKPARHGGLGSTVMGPPDALSAVVCMASLSVGVALLWSGTGAMGLLLGLGGLVLALGVPHVLSMRFGGVTGDVMGASVLITESLLFFAFALAV